MKRFLLSLFLFATGLSTAPVFAQTLDELVILSPHWEGIKYEYTQAFLRHLKREVKVRWIDVGGTSDILRYIETSSTDTSEIKADILFGGGTFPFAILAKKDLLETPNLPNETLERLPKQIGSLSLIDPSGRWFSAMLATFGILCNRSALERLQLPLPTSWADLADSRYVSWIGAADPRKSGSAHVVYEIILQAYGWERGWHILKGIGRNVRSFNAGSSELPHSVLVGEVACTMLIDSYAAHSMSTVGGEVLTFQVPQGKSPFSGDAIALLKGSRNPSLAKEFIAFVLSPEGQRLLALEPGVDGGPKQFRLRRLSVLPSLYTEKETAGGFMLNPFSGFNEFPFNEDLASARWDLLNDLMGTFIIEPPQGATSPSPPIAQQQASLLAAQWNDPVVRLSTLAEWKRLVELPPSKVSIIKIVGFGFYIFLLLGCLRVSQRLLPSVRALFS